MLNFKGESLNHLVPKYKQNLCVTLCAKGILDLNFNQVVINKNINFHKIASNLTYSIKIVFFYNI